jgi:hypothetical protein
MKPRYDLLAIVPVLLVALAGCGSDEDGDASTSDGGAGAGAAGSGGAGGAGAAGGEGGAGNAGGMSGCAEGAVGCAAYVAECLSTTPPAAYCAAPTFCDGSEALVDAATMCACLECAAECGGSVCEDPSLPDCGACLMTILGDSGACSREGAACSADVPHM